MLKGYLSSEILGHATTLPMNYFPTHSCICRPQTKYQVEEAVARVHINRITFYSSCWIELFQVQVEDVYIAYIPY